MPNTKERNTNQDTKHPDTRSTMKPDEPIIHQDLRQVFTRHHDVDGGCKKEHELRKEETDDTTWLTKGGISDICITCESFAATKL